MLLCRFLGSKNNQKTEEKIMEENIYCSGCGRELTEETATLFNDSGTAKIVLMNLPIYATAAEHEQTEEMQ